METTATKQDSPAITKVPKTSRKEGKRASRSYISKTKRAKSTYAPLLPAESRLSPSDYSVPGAEWKLKKVYSEAEVDREEGRKKERIEEDEDEDEDEEPVPLPALNLDSKMIEGVEIKEVLDQVQDEDEMFAPLLADLASRQEESSVWDLQAEMMRLADETAKQLEADDGFSSLGDAADEPIEMMDSVEYMKRQKQRVENLRQSDLSDILGQMAPNTPAQVKRHNLEQEKKNRGHYDTVGENEDEDDDEDEDEDEEVEREGYNYWSGRLLQSKMNAIRHVAVVFGMPLMEDEITRVYASRLRKLVTMIKDGELRPDVICFCGGVSPDNHLSQADAGFMFFKQLVKGQQIFMGPAKYFVDRLSSNELEAVEAVAKHIEEEHLAEWLDEMEQDDKDETEEAYGASTRRKLRIHFSLISSDYHVFNIHDVHERSSTTSFLQPLEHFKDTNFLESWRDKHPAKTSSAQDEEDDSETDEDEDLLFYRSYGSAFPPTDFQRRMDIILEPSWSYQYAPYPYLYSSDETKRFMAKLLLLFEKVAPVLYNIFGVLEEVSVLRWLVLCYHHHHQPTWRIQWFHRKNFSKRPTTSCSKKRGQN